MLPPGMENTSMAAALAKTQLEPVEPALIIFGLDDAKRPHGSYFGAADAPAAEFAARTMGFLAHRLATAGEREVAATLAPGKLFASGRAFVPFVRADLFDRLLKLVPAGALEAAAKTRIKLVASTPATTPASQAGASSPKKPIDYELPRDWATIRAGCLVLAYSKDDQSWFEAVVVTVEPNDVFGLTWRDYPDSAKFFMHRKKLGLLHPEFVA
jgi:hypothetical protein